MDPQVCWAELERAESDRDRARIAECADALIGWLEKDGFVPPVFINRGIDRKNALWMLRTIRHVAEML